MGTFFVSIKEFLCYCSNKTIVSFNILNKQK